MEESRLDDRRLFDRFSARFPAKFKHLRNDYGTDVFLRDASAQGLKITSRQRLFLNDSVSLIVQLPDGTEPMTLNGRVTWTKSRGPQMWDVGLEFHKVNLMEMQRVFRLVNTV